MYFHLKKIYLLGFSIHMNDGNGIKSLTTGFCNMLDVIKCLNRKNKKKKNCTTNGNFLSRNPFTV